ncbi:tyrosine-type recombinase/integrase [Streptomyces albireticuli]|uniref:tyrosine-type recombinase/integrase n=1 Tax=Streptomyces albireticuli TaxID=1940 RepID=UPI00367B0CDF
MATVFQPCKTSKANKHYPCEKKRCGHAWTVRYREPGGRTGRQREASFPTQTEAKDHGVKMENDKRAGVYLDPKRGAITVKAWSEEWMGAQVLNFNTERDYRGFVKNYLVPHMGRKTLANVTTQDIQRLVARMAKAGLEGSTIKTRMIPLRAMLNAAVGDKRIAESPYKAKSLTFPRVSSQQVDPDDIPTQDEVDAITAELPPQYRLVASLISGAGLRPSEAFGVSEDCERGDWFRVYRQATDKAATGEGRKALVPLKHRAEGDYREIPLALYLADEIAAHKAAHGTRTVDETPGLLFASKLGGLLTHEGFYYHWRKVMKKLSLAYKPHSLRHFFASTALANGVSLLEVSRWLGHRSIKVTGDTYGHLVKEAPERLRLVMQNAFRPKLVVVQGSGQDARQMTKAA